MRPYSAWKLSTKALLAASAEIGGDVWGVQQLDETHLGLYVADLSGHGVASAINAFRLHTVLADSKPVPGKLPEFFSHLNGTMFNALPTGQFSAFLYAVFDLETDSLSYVPCFCPDPATGNQGSGRYQFLSGAGRPLGISDSFETEVTTIKFPKGSFLFIYSDALIEARTSSGDRLPEDWLEHHLPNAAAEENAHASLRNINRAFDRDVPGPLGDDLTLVWLTRL